MYMDQALSFHSLCNDGDSVKKQNWNLFKGLLKDTAEDLLKKQNWNLFKGLLKDTAEERAYR